jgi:hypothetical protein
MRGKGVGERSQRLGVRPRDADVVGQLMGGSLTAGSRDIAADQSYLVLRADALGRFADVLRQVAEGLTAILSESSGGR